MSSHIQVPLVSVIRNARRIPILLILGHFLILLAVLLTPLGFPYSAPGSADSLGAKQQRVQILVGLTLFSFGYVFDQSQLVNLLVGGQQKSTQHVERTFYDSKGLVRQRDSGYWLLGLDRHVGPESLAPLEPKEPVERVSESACHALPYCGLPYYFPSLKRIRCVLLKKEVLLKDG